jgi:hypothetical protein
MVVCTPRYRDERLCVPSQNKKSFFSLLKLTARAEVSPLLPKYPDGFTFCSYVLSRGQGENESISAWEKK